jgi:hypothetical protein
LYLSRCSASVGTLRRHSSTTRSLVMPLFFAWFLILSVWLEIEFWIFSMRWARARFSTKSNMVSFSTGGKKEVSSKSDSSWYELLEKEAERERPGVETGWFADEDGGSSRKAEPAWVESPGSGRAERAETPSWGSEWDLGGTGPASSSGADMVGTSSWTISRLEGVRRWRGRFRERGGEAGAMITVSGRAAASVSRGVHGGEKGATVGKSVQ